MTKTDLIQNHYTLGSIRERIDAGLHALGKDLGNLTSEDLSPVDAFHTRGKASTLELAELAECKPGQKVLDVGCGLGGSARFLAETFGCEVEAIDLTPEYIEVARDLTQRVGVTPEINFKQGSALELPYPDNSFDVVWTEHVQMNIEDKEGFYREIARVLKPGGRFVFHDIFSGGGGEIHVPVPWARETSMSFLLPSTEVLPLLEKLGLEVGKWVDKCRISLDFFEEVVARIKEKGTPPLGIHLLMGETAPQKIQNYIKNLKEDRTAVYQGFAIKKA